MASTRGANRCAPSGAAAASFEEHRKGALEVGRLADFVMLDRHLFDIPPDEIRDARVLVTAVGGRMVFERQGSWSRP